MGEEYTMRFGFVDVDSINKHVGVGDGVYVEYSTTDIGTLLARVGWERGYSGPPTQRVILQITDVPRKVIWALRNADVWSVPDPDDEDEWEDDDG